MLKNAEKILEYGKDRELISIIYRGNGVVNLNYYDESRPLDFNNVSVTARYIDGELIYTDEHDTEYELAFCPQKAVYPDITELFN